jgi:LysM domain
MEAAMNALTAAALTCGSEDRPGRSRAEDGCAERDQAESGNAVILPLRAPRPPAAPLRAPAVPPSPAAVPPRASAAPPGAADAPLRLTRRGRAVVAAAAALLVTAISLLAAGVAQATSHALSPHAARQNLIQVVVRPGQSLWSVAESTDPDQDPRAVIQQIIDLNALSSDAVFPGEQLWVPRG